MSDPKEEKQTTMEERTTWKEGDLSDIMMPDPKTGKMVPWTPSSNSEDKE